MNHAFLSFARMAAGTTLLVANISHAIEIRCPSTMSETPVVQLPDQQWAVFAKSGERPVEQAGIYLVANGEYGAQIPDSTHQIGKNEEQVRWQMTGSPTEIFAVGCSYTGTTAMLFKTVDGNTKRCVATYTLLPTGRRQRLKSMNCD